ncbi:5-formyltetrahydrofolate cyclo-ligase [Salinispira pacifica]|uniref:5-formyltetrahydrofolate cyclo-ligase n=1 Tax=Salinispira pacifica TaxID=1307761 RepID=V5WD72_9SPIO|nr:5-formyltetrahydrofolate cyclo-ligase [Salinispira pacifica]AHC13747.1 5-formyltetrahydrofolate cyclo-ligase [Salinispira pacifica]
MDNGAGEAGDVKRKKKLLRREIRKELDNLSRERRNGEAAAITSQLRSLDEWKNARFILAYVPMKEEVPILPLLKQASREGKRIFLPRVESPEHPLHPPRTLGGKVLGFHEWITMSMDELELDAYNIPVPRIEDSRRLEAAPDYRQQDSLVIVPGLGFTTGGDRLGRGGGFYDQFLESHRDIFSAALCFTCQIRSSLPLEPGDQRVHKVISLQEGKIWDT